MFRRASVDWDSAVIKDRHDHKSCVGFVISFMLKKARVYITTATSAHGYLTANCHVKQDFAYDAECVMVAFVDRRAGGGDDAGAERNSQHSIPRQRVGVRTISLSRTRPRGDSCQLWVVTCRLAPLGAAVGLLTLIVAACGVCGSRAFVIAHSSLHTTDILCTQRAPHAPCCDDSIPPCISQARAQPVARVLLFHLVRASAAWCLRGCRFALATPVC